MFFFCVLPVQHETRPECPQMCPNVPLVPSICSHRTALQTTENTPCISYLETPYNTYHLSTHKWYHPPNNRTQHPPHLKYCPACASLSLYTCTSRLLLSLPKTHFHSLFYIFYIFYIFSILSIFTSSPCLPPYSSSQFPQTSSLLHIQFIITIHYFVPP